MSDMEVPSVLCFVEKDMKSMTTRLHFQLKVGNYKWKQYITLSDEFMAEAKDHFIKIHIAEQVAREFHNHLEWLDEQWMRSQIEHILQLQEPGHKTLLEGGPKSAGEYADEDLYDEDYEAGVLSTAATKLPGMEALVPWPCGCNDEGKAQLMTVIMHINDVHVENSKKGAWTSDELCDWLDKLHDDGVVNLEVQILDKEIQ